MNDADEGDDCPDCGHGKMELALDGECYCCALGRMAPCSACENTYLECSECGWRPEDEDGLREILDDGVKFWKDMGGKWSDPASILDLFKLEEE
jgi:hypothetical protein